MTILITGATGFLGQAICNHLNSLQVPSVSLGQSAVNEIRCNLANEIPEIPEVELVIHAAGKAHFIPKTDDEKADFFKVNVRGTENLLAGLENNTSLKKFIFISSVAVYGLMEGTEIDENNPLNATDAYGKSKIEAELIIQNWCITKNIEYYILRLPLIAGANPPGNLGAMLKALKKGFYFSIGKADVKKSMVLARDVAELIPKVNGKPGIYNLTDGYHPTFDELEKGLAKALNVKNPFKIPQTVATLIAKIGDILGSKSPINSQKLKKIQSTLTFSDKKAREELGWNPSHVLDNLDKIVITKL
jgi:nucleoside-diphosphate-sugar epimerase